MTALVHYPLFHLFFDLTVNDGWNMVAWTTYTLIIGLTWLVITEKKRKG